LRVFLQCAAEVDGEITENHKRRWLLIQLAPATLLDGVDIFALFAEPVGRASSQFLLDAILDESAIIKGLLPPPSTLFCVLDEAQTLTKNLNYFRSSADPKKSRPILRPIVAAWSQFFKNLIVSGTGMAMRDVGTVLGSAVAKEGGLPPVMVTEIGGFDDEDSRQAYLKRYFPPGFLDTPEGEEIAHRVGYWLRGRFVFNAAL